MQELIKLSLDYIEQNLKTEIRAEELAEMAGYSVWHYYWLFNKITGSSVLNYILKRRLDYALGEIANGRKAISVALEYGFDTYAGFYKAFVKMYGCSPKKYLSIYNNKKSEVFMHSINEIKEILGNWDISADLKIEDITHTNWETQEKSEWETWQIGEYYLKTNERSKMIRSIKIAKALKKQGLDSEFLPIPTKSGEDYPDGKELFLLVKKIGRLPNNRPLSDDEIGRLENNGLREKYAFNLGQAVAKIHKALLTVQDDVKPYEGDLYAPWKQAIPKVREANMGISEEFFSDYIETFGKLYDKLPKQLIHGNLCGDCVVYSENGEIICVKSFEHENVSHVRIFDITWCAGEINAQPDIDLYLTTLKEIIRGYDSINPLTAEEKQAFYYVLCANCINGFGYFDEQLDITSRGNRALIYLANNKDKFMNLI